MVHLLDWKQKHEKSYNWIYFTILSFTYRRKHRNNSKVTKWTKKSIQLSTQPLPTGVLPIAKDINKTVRVFEQNAPFTVESIKFPISFDFWKNWKSWPKQNKALPDSGKRSRIWAIERQYGISLQTIADIHFLNAKQSESPLLADNMRITIRLLSLCLVITSEAH